MKINFNEFRDYIEDGFMIYNKKGEKRPYNPLKHESDYMMWDFAEGLAHDIRWFLQSKGIEFDYGHYEKEEGNARHKRFERGTA